MAALVCVRVCAECAWGCLPRILNTRLAPVRVSVCVLSVRGAGCHRDNLAVLLQLLRVPAGAGEHRNQQKAPGPGWLRLPTCPLADAPCHLASAPAGICLEVGLLLEGLERTELIGD